MNSNIATMVTEELGVPKLKSILGDIFRIGRHSSEESVRILFGFAWGNFYGDWTEIQCTWDEALKHIETAELEGHGSIGSDDLYIYIGADEFQFCHHADIHYPSKPQTQLGAEVGAYLSSVAT